MTQKTKRIRDMSLDELQTETDRLSKKLVVIHEKCIAEKNAAKSEVLHDNLRILQKRSYAIKAEFNRRSAKKKERAGHKTPPRTQFDSKPTRPTYDRQAADQEDDDPNPAMTLAKKLQEAAIPSWMKKDEPAADDAVGEVAADGSTGYVYKRIEI